VNTEPWGVFAPGADHGVDSIQYLLRAQGHPVVVDNAYGPATAGAVKALQSAAGIAVDGIVGPVTWPHLVVATRAGSAGDAVRAVQAFRLPEGPGGPEMVVDGVYGPDTEHHVRTFQGQWGLTVDGVAGRETWSFLASAPDPWGLVKQGQTQNGNWRVLAAQHLLRAHGATISADGIFGPASGTATRAFQQTLRATDLGTTVGQLDWPHLIVTVRQGDHGEAVRGLQSLLQVIVDGVFGAQTDAAVRNFQQQFAPPPDGIAGPRTWHSLMVPLFE
jgi:peptidoglycan hydrolase-like protein with peptidoglycan-binding domain